MLCVISRTVVSYAGTIVFGFLCVRFFLSFLLTKRIGKEKRPKPNGVFVSEECLKFVVCRLKRLVIEFTDSKSFFCVLFHQIQWSELSTEKAIGSRKFIAVRHNFVKYSFNDAFFLYKCFNLVHALLFRITRDCGISCCGRNTHRYSEQYRWAMLNEWPHTKFDKIERKR